MIHRLWPMLAWAAQFVLEVAGWSVWRRRNGFLALFLGVSAVADLTTFSIAWGFGDKAYSYASWAAEGVSYALLCLLACQLAANVAGPLWRYAGGLAVAGATIVTVIVRHEPNWMGKFLDAEIAASCYLCVALLIAWIGKERLPQPWGAIMAGIMMLVGGNALCALLWEKHLAGPMLYFVPEILGLGILAWAGWRNYECEEVRLPLPKKKPPTSVGNPEILEMFGG